MWYVSLLPDPDGRTDARVSGGAIERMSAPPELKAELDAVDADQRPFVLAAAGIWYDALAVLSAGAGDATRGAQPRARRAALLQQVGLGNVAVP